jgi:hypothetical protein
MILNIILVVVMIKIGFDLFNQIEGMVDIEPPPLMNMKDCDYASNIVFPNFDEKRNLYQNDNNSIYYSYQNILKYTKTPCTPVK